MRDGPIEMVSRLDVEWSAKLVLSSDSHQSNIFSIRFFFLLLEWAVHGVPWIIGTVWAACRSFHFNYPAHEQRRACILVFGIFLDLLITGILKLSFRRPRPPYNKGNDQIFDAPVADKFSFPSGHSSRSAMLAVLGFALIQPQDLLLKAALFAYPVVLGLSRIAMGRHYIADVLAGLLFGFFEGRIALMLPQEAVDLGNRVYQYFIADLF